MAITHFCQPGNWRVRKPIDNVHAIAILELDRDWTAQRISQTEGIGLRQSPGRNHLHKQSITAIRLSNFTQCAVSFPDFAILPDLRPKNSIAVAVVGDDRAQLKLWPLTNDIDDGPA